ncbi:hypothetical protein PTSG_01525 [Salpingoeca rosetta]|uniref:GRAM domain-containing protein n=1 Tax=Salpingoeca rosetta (strain ATCC 50818 / BSB-021) TaxID=946362 RepID=F2U0L4_SALR5|nr:uncharacterized protein PTSG_01525 [Salpingoeca rosetta]EGD80942.1 hypothetical protein PTSG_01525 [Salpingoeca rosetta]|eukprot:XP_004997503.1 hypothetical protein PTSG_01525 [Salpingoeca rosetta]
MADEEPASLSSSASTATANTTTSSNSSGSDEAHASAPPAHALDPVMDVDDHGENDDDDVDVDDVDDDEPQQDAGDNTPSGRGASPKDDDDDLLDIDDDPNDNAVIHESDADDGFVEVRHGGDRTGQRRGGSSQSPSPVDASPRAVSPETAPGHTQLSTSEAVKRVSGAAVKYVTSWQEFVVDVVSEMKNPTRPITQEVEDDGAALNRHLLVRNFKRLKRALQPAIDGHHAVLRIMHWENPYQSAAALTVYSVCAYYNMLLPVMLAGLLSFLGVHYLRHQRQPHRTPAVENDDDDRSLIEKARAVKEIMRRVQNGVGKAADHIEKIHNLLLWRAPEQSLKLFIGVLAAFLLTFFTPQWFWLTLLKIVIGVRFLVQPGLYHNYPRLREKYDSNKFIDKLPTNVQAERRARTAAAAAASAAAASDRDRIGDGDGGGQGSSGRSFSPRRPRFRGRPQHTASPSPLRDGSSSSGGGGANGNSAGAARGSSQHDDEGRTRSESLRKTQERSEGDVLCDLGVPLSEQIIETNQCFYMPDRRLTNLRRGRLWVTDTFFCFMPNSKDDSKFCFHLSRLMKLERTGKVLGSRGLMVQLTFKEVTGAPVVKTLSGILNPTALINAISKQQRLVAERTQGTALAPS